MAQTDTDAAARLADSLLTAQEEEALILALANTRGDRSFTTEEAAQLLEYARRLRLQSRALSLAMLGLVSLDLDPEGRPIFGRQESHYPH